VSSRQRREASRASEVDRLIAADEEAIVLGALMTDPDALSVLGDLELDDFGIERNRLLFAVVRSLASSGSAVDRVTVARHLRDSGDLERVGGVGYLVDLDKDMPRIVALGDYIRILKDKAHARRLMKVAAGIERKVMQESSDPNEISKWACQELLSRNGHGSTSLASVSDCVTGAGGAEAILHPRGLLGVPTRIRPLDHITGGMRAGELFVLAARPGFGKTSLAMSIAVAAAVTERCPVAVFSLEMPRDAIIRRCVSSLARAPLIKPTAEERHRLMIALTKLVEAPLFIDDTPHCDIGSMVAKCRAAKVRHNIRVVVLDYLQLATSPGADNRVQEVSVISRTLKVLAMELGVTVLALSQLSRAVESRVGDRTPMLSDLRDSGSIEQDADLVTFINRPAFYKGEEPPTGLVDAELIVAKNRHGRIGRAMVKFCRETGSFIDAPDAGE